VGVPGGRPTGAPARPDVAAPAADLAALYRRMGLAVAGGDVPFVARVAYLAGRTPDSTLTHLTLSLAARALTFTREEAGASGYRATYQVRLEARRAPGAGRPAATLPVLRETVGDAVVRVATFRETTRVDESVLHAQALALAPGPYTLAVTVRDVESGRTTTADLTVRVPRLGAGVAGGALSTPVAVHDARPRLRTADAPRLLVNVRGTSVFGRDSVARVYLEAYGGAAAGAPPPADVLVRDDRGAVLWRDTLAFGLPAPAASPAAAPADSSRAAAPRVAVAQLPVARLGFGLVTFLAVRRGAAADTVATPLFVAEGDELPAATFDEALEYLRYFAAPARLAAVRTAPPAARPARWAALLRETDPDARTPAHEALVDYVARLRAAAVRFAEDQAPGWRTDRGRAYLVLGEPDQITDANVPEQGQRGRTQVWEYREPRVQLVFTDQYGIGRWRLPPAGVAALDAVLARRFAG
jgi:GWxTD domain-containing protein